MIYDIKKNVWSTKLLKLFDIPEDILPEVKDCADDFGLASLFDKEIKIGGSLFKPRVCEIYIWNWMLYDHEYG